jgi:putative membrane-bound dehydrogenase-like protein
MNLAFSSDGRLYLTHRNGVIILRDKDGDGVSESRTTVLQMDTAANYPHNGIGGIAFSPDGWMFVGMGENFGEKYTIKGSDGSSHSGGGEGGNVFRCRPDGSQLKLVATGFWNAFGLAFNRDGYLFCVDNDPDSRPPCRLLDVVTGADFGYKYGYGRSGLHPFTAWNGELPGTLPMIAGTGEAPSGILDCDYAKLPARYAGGLLITSWGDHQIEFYRPKPSGASLRAEREVIAQGDEWFRPVGIAATSDGTVYFTDWVDKDYSVHRKGRIWRLAARPGTKASIAAAKPHKTRPNPARQRMLHLLEADSPEDYAELLRGLTDGDAFVRSGAMTSLARPPFREGILREQNNKDPRARLGALLVLRRAKYEHPAPLLEKWLADTDADIRRMALVWAGEEKLSGLASHLNAVLSAGPVTPLLLQTFKTASEILNGTNAEPTIPQSGTAHSSAGRTLVLNMAVKHDPAQAIDVLADPRSDRLGQLRIEAARTMAESPGDKATTVLLSAALSRKNPAELRAEAILALAGQSAAVLSKLTGLLDDPSATIRIETTRALRSSASHPVVRDALQKKLQSLGDGARDRMLAEQLRFALFPPGATSVQPDRSDSVRPSSEEQWRKALSEGGNVASGRRVFFNPSVGCARCHRIEDHGGKIGPDLSTIARSADREKLMQSILHPSREIAPQFVQYVVETKDGQSYSGLLAGASADGSVTLMTADGNGVVIPVEQIVSNLTSSVSLMPEGLENALAVQDFRDLLVFLLSLQ